MATKCDDEEERNGTLTILIGNFRKDKDLQEGNDAGDDSGTHRYESTDLLSFVKRSSPQELPRKQGKYNVHGSRVD